MKFFSKKYFLIYSVITLLGVSVVAPVFAQQSAPLKPSEQYFITLLNALEQEKLKFEEQNNRPMTAADWYQYLKKMYPIEVQFPKNMTEKGKEQYIRSAVLAFAWLKYGFGYTQMPAGAQKIELRCGPVPGAPPGALVPPLGESHIENGALVFNCPLAKSSAAQTMVFAHEGIHGFGGIKQGNEQQVHEKLRRNLPGLFKDPTGAPVSDGKGGMVQNNYPAEYDIFMPKQDRLVVPASQNNSIPPPSSDAQKLLELQKQNEELRNRLNLLPQPMP